MAAYPEFGSVRMIFETVSSTMDVARSWAAAGAEHGTVICAAHQESGRGRRGATWTDQAGGESLMATFIAKSTLDECELWKIPFAASFAVLEAVRHFGAENAALKWPNDVVCGECKLSGILVENLARLGKEKISLIGVGINVAQKDFPEAVGYARKPVSLRMILHEKTPSTEDLLNALCERLTCSFSQITPEADGWNKLAATWGALMTRNIAQTGIGPDGEIVGGMIRSLRLDDGAALIEEASGNIVAARPLI